MPTDKELMQQALDALERFATDETPDGWFAISAIQALRARLAQPEPEPVAWHEPGAYGNVTVYEGWAKENGWLPLYTASPQREWQGLTDEEREEATGWSVEHIETKLKAKNGY